MKQALQIFSFQCSMFFTKITYISKAILKLHHKIQYTLKEYDLKKTFLLSMVLLFVFYALSLQKDFSFSKSMPTQWILQQCAKEASANSLTKGITYHAGKSNIVYYNQENSLWGNEKYGKTDLISETGCGPTTLAMVISTLTDIKITPKEMADWSYENGYCAEGSGSYHTLIEEGAKAFGIAVEQADVTQGQKIADALANGKLVIALLGKGTFTNSGHFIVLRGITEDGTVLVADPKSIANSQKGFPFGLILEEAKGGVGSLGPFWIMS